MSKPKLHIIVASTRPGRKGPIVGEWFKQFADGFGQFETRLLDLAEFDLPLYNEPNHPVLQKYKHDHTRQWAEAIDAADAYVFVTPEYHHNPPAALINALGYLTHEWHYKTCGFVSYGGAAGGVRAVQATKVLTTTLKMMPVLEGVMIPMMWELIDAQGTLQSNELIDDSAEKMLAELLRWTHATRTMRQANA